jgi:Lon protease-like protein
MYAAFPLNIVVLPDECVALHLFEPRYRQLFKDHKGGEEFVIVRQHQGVRSEYGTLVYIEKIVNEFPDETVDVIVKGSSIVKIDQFHDLYPTKLYSAVDVELKEINTSPSDNLISEFEQYLSASKKRIVKEHSNSLFYIANRLEMNTEAKDELIELANGEQMNRYLLNQIKFLNKIREQEGLLNQNFHLN